MRGNCRTSGEQRRKESGNVFGEGSRTPISITILVRKPKKDPDELAAILYKDIGDYLTREDKLKTIKDFGSMLSASIGLSSIAPNQAGDWINQRDGLFETFLPLECEGKFNTKSSSVFCVNSRGLETARDSWVYNSSLHQLTETTQRMVAFYNEQVSNFANRKEKTIAAKDFITYDPTKISWSTNLIEAVQKGATATFEQDRFSIGMYRPFFKQHVYRGEKFINRRGQFDQFFPTPQSKNIDAGKLLLEALAETVHCITVDPARVRDKRNNSASVALLLLVGFFKAICRPTKRLDVGIVKRVLVGRL